jgi:TonB family protein
MFGTRSNGHAANRSFRRRFMFDRLVITNSGQIQTDRNWFFLFSTIIVFTALVGGLLTSLFSKELSLGNDNFELVQLVAPVEQPVIEPEPPEPEEPTQQRVIQEQTVESAPTRHVERARTTRRVNMARTDETPPAVPEGVSTTPNTYKARPANRYFGLGKADIDHSEYAAGRLNNGGSSSGSGSASSSGSGESVAALKKPVPPPPPPPRKKTIAVKKSITRSLGVINGKATSLPKPRYPLTARAVRAEGKVSVKVLIDERGRVVSANALSGHPLLRNAAEAAARQAEFSPTLLSGEAVKVSGVIVYNFSV